MSHIHFIGGEKGGVGKSVVCRVLAQYFIDHGMPFRGFDTDRSHGALLRFYADFAQPAVLDQHDSLDPVIECALDSSTYWSTSLRKLISHWRAGLPTPTCWGSPQRLALR